MKRKRFFSSAEKLEQRRKRLDAIALSKGEKTEKEIKEQFSGKSKKQEQPWNSWKIVKERLEVIAQEKKEEEKEKAFLEKQKKQKEHDELLYRGMIEFGRKMPWEKEKA